MRKTTYIILVLLSLSNTVQGKDYASYVNPLIGSGGHGHVFVGANVPFGAVQVGPMNKFQGWDWSSGYFYADPVIIGFSHTHLSGTGCADLGDISLMPFSGKKNKEILSDVTSTYNHSNEKAEPGYYSVSLDNGVTVEISATKRAGIQHYTYTHDSDSYVLIDLFNAVGSCAYESSIRRVDEYTVEGYHYMNGWAPQHKVFFYARFNKPFRSLAIYKSDVYVAEGATNDACGLKGVADFGREKDLIVKVGISSVSCENARLNVDTELPSWDFHAVRDSARKAWNKELSVVDIDGTDQQKTIFYTSLYHMMIAPSLYCDVNGHFRGIDDRIWTSEGNNYSTFSLWDTYRTLHPIFTILEADKVNDFVNSMLKIYDQNGILPVWPLWGGETYQMPGYSSVPVIADAYMKGFRGFDAQHAIKRMVATATSKRMPGMELFKNYGYIPADKIREATSINLEYAVDDWSIARMAKALGMDNIFEEFRRRGCSYIKLWDPAILKIHPKMADGSWYEPYDPCLANHRDGVGDFTEGNGWEYTFMVPQDPTGLITAHGGDAVFIKNMDDFFAAKGDLGEGASPDISGLIGMYAHGNEPSHHIPYLYVYAGQQWKTAAIVRKIQREFYKAEPDGYIGNEDCGQMSAWYVSSALGFFQVTPSDGIYSFGSPLFGRATISLPEGKKFIIIAHNNNERNIYIQRVTLNGKPYTKSYITYDDIMRGGTIEFTMGNRPNKKYGKKKEDCPNSSME